MPDTPENRALNMKKTHPWIFPNDKGGIGKATAAGTTLFKKRVS